MDRTAFVTNKGLYRYIRVSFSLKNAPATFQRAVDIIPAPEKWQHALVYVDAVVIHSLTPEEHLNLESCQGRPTDDRRGRNDTEAKKKCFRFSSVIDNLGHVIAPKRLHVATKT